MLQGGGKEATGVGRKPWMAGTTISKRAASSWTYREVEEEGHSWCLSSNSIREVDFFVCLGAHLGVIFGSVEIGLVIAVVAMSILPVLLFVARTRTFVLGNSPNSMVYRRMDQYPVAQSVPGLFILHIDAPIYFASASYSRERISRSIDEEEDKLKSKGETSLQYVILDLGAVSSIDTSGISMLEEVKNSVDRSGLQLVLANPGSEIIKKLEKSKVLETIGQEWIFLTVGEVIAACNFILHTRRLGDVNEMSKC
ncbi:sulfate transporter 3.1-like [Elaeis guineensis]|uniref:sulfate transporter 3.1-like n=1 Tax=Elaeis guineensis var. tenera TaxID=51953 RepID=UPI003C6CF74D